MANKLSALTGEKGIKRGDTGWLTNHQKLTGEKRIKRSYRVANKLSDIIREKGIKRGDAGWPTHYLVIANYISKTKSYVEANIRKLLSMKSVYIFFMLGLSLSCTIYIACYFIKLNKLKGVKGKSRKSTFNTNKID